MERCPYCGRPQPDDVLQCGACGQDLVTPEEGWRVKVRHAVLDVRLSTLRAWVRQWRVHRNDAVYHPARDAWVAAGNLPSLVDDWPTAPPRATPLLVARRFALVIAFACFALVDVFLVVGMYDGQARRARGDLELIQAANATFLELNGHYPSATEGVNALVLEGLLEDLPVDPWGRPYLYRLTGGHPLVGSLGADGAPGGRGRDADHWLAGTPLR